MGGVWLVSVYGAFATNGADGASVTPFLQAMINTAVVGGSSAGALLAPARPLLRHCARHPSGPHAKCMPLLSNPPFLPAAAPPPPTLPHILPCPSRSRVMEGSSAVPNRPDPKYSHAPSRHASRMLSFRDGAGAMNQPTSEILVTGSSVESYSAVASGSIFQRDQGNRLVAMPARAHHAPRTMYHVHITRTHHAPSNCKRAHVCQHLWATAPA